MKIETFPATMWKNMGTDGKAPAVKRAWKYQAICGKFNDQEEDMPKLSGCGAKLTLTKKDYYKKTSPDGDRISFWFMCPCCATENPIMITALELNAKVKEKNEWLADRRDAIVAELLLGRELPEGCALRTEKLLDKLKVPLPECYEPIQQLASAIEE